VAEHAVKVSGLKTVLICFFDCKGIMYQVYLVRLSTRIQFSSFRISETVVSSCGSRIVPREVDATP
jgi:uncharacterized membrane protein YhiD involved in acid resistance